MSKIDPPIPEWVPKERQEVRVELFLGVVLLSSPRVIMSGAVPQAPTEGSYLCQKKLFSKFGANF